MIKGLTSVALVASEEAFTQLGELFQALGFEQGKGWDDGAGKGAAFLAPVGNLELVTGRAPALPALLVEVTQLDTVHAAVKTWMSARLAAAQQGSADFAAKLSEVELTHWNSRLFTVELAVGAECRVLGVGEPAA